MLKAQTKEFLDLMKRIEDLTGGTLEPDNPA